METNKFDVLKMQLVEYFKQIEKYQVHKRKWSLRKNKDHSIYLINLFNKSYQIIKIIDHSTVDIKWSAKDLKQNQNEINSFRKEVITTNHSKLQVLTLVLTKEVTEPLLFSNNDGIVFVNLETVVAQLRTIYPQISQIETIELNTKINEEEVFDPSSLTEDDFKEGSLLQKRMKDFQSLTTKKNIFLTYFLAITPFLVPLLAMFFVSQLRVILQAQGQGGISIFDAGINIEAQLFLGGAYKHLIFAAGQFWRWITFPFAGADALTLILSCFAIFFCGRLVESFYGTWRLALIVICSTIILGFVHSVIIPATFSSKITFMPNVLSGPIFWVWIMAAPLFIFSFAKKDFSAYVVRRRLILPAVVLALTLIRDAERLFLTYMLAFMISFLISYFLGFSKQSWNWKRIVAGSLVVVLVVTVLVLYLTSNTAIINDNNGLKMALDNYVKAGLLTQDRATAILMKVS